MSVCNSLRIDKICRDTGINSGYLEGVYELYDGTCWDTIDEVPLTGARVYRHTTSSGVYIISQPSVELTDDLLPDVGDLSPRGWSLISFELSNDKSCRNTPDFESSNGDYGATRPISWPSLYKDDPRPLFTSEILCWHDEDFDFVEREFDITCLSGSPASGFGGGFSGNGGSYGGDSDYSYAGGSDNGYSFSSGSAGSSDRDVLPGGAIAGIVVGLFLVILSIVGCICCCCCACHKSSNNSTTKAVKLDAVDPTHVADDTESPLGSTKEDDLGYEVPVVAAMMHASDKKEPIDLEGQTRLELTSSARDEIPCKVSVTDNIDSEGHWLESIRSETFLDGTTLKTSTNLQSSKRMPLGDLPVSGQAEEEEKSEEEPEPTDMDSLQMMPPLSHEFVMQEDEADKSLDWSAHSYESVDCPSAEEEPAVSPSLSSEPTKGQEPPADDTIGAIMPLSSHTGHATMEDEWDDYVPATRVEEDDEKAKPKKSKKKSKKKPSSTGMIGQSSQEGSKKKKKQKKPSSTGMVGDVEAEKKKKSISSSSKSSSRPRDSKRTKKSPRKSSSTFRQPAGE